MERKSAEDLKKEFAERFVNSLNEDKLAWAKEWKKGFVPMNATTEHEYRGLNKLVLMFAAKDQKWEGYRFATFDQIKRQKGWHLKKGSKAVRIFSPKLYNYYPDDKSIKPRSVEQDKKDALINNKKASEKNFGAPYVRYWSVFPEDMIEGIDKDLNIHEYSNDEKFNILKNYMKKASVDLYQSQMNSDCYFNPIDNQIVLPVDSHFDSKEAMLATLAHEIAHSTGTALGRDMSGRNGDEKYAKEELRAEIASVFICAELGIDASLNINNNVAYVQGWSERIKANPKVLFDAITDAEKICSYVMELGKETEITQDILTEEKGNTHESEKDKQVESKEKPSKAKALLNALKNRTSSFGQEKVREKSLEK